MLSPDSLIGEIIVSIKRRFYYVGSVSLEQALHSVGMAASELVFRVHYRLGHEESFGALG